MRHDIDKLAADLRRVMLDGYDLERDYATDAPDPSGPEPDAPRIDARTLVLEIVDAFDRADRYEAEAARLRDRLAACEAERDAHECPDPEPCPECPDCGDGGDGDPPAEPEPDPQPVPEPEPTPEPSDLPALPSGAWVRVSSLGAPARMVPESAECTALRLPTDPQQGSPAVFRDGVLTGILSPGPRGFTGAVSLLGGDYFTTGEHEWLDLPDDVQAELDALGLSPRLLVFYGREAQFVGFLDPWTGRIDLEHEGAEDGRTVSGIVERTWWDGEDRTAELAAIHQAGDGILYDVPCVGRPPAGAHLHCSGGAIVKPPGALGPCVETPGAELYGEVLPEAPVYGDLTGYGSLPTFDWSRTPDIGTQPHHGLHVHACRGARFGVVDFRGTVGDPVYTDGDPDYGPTERRPLAFQSETAATFTGPVDEPRRKHHNPGRGRFVLHTPEGELWGGPVYATWGEVEPGRDNWFPLFRPGDLPKLNGWKEDPEAFRASVVAWGTIWGQLAFTDPVPADWREPGAVQAECKGATCLAPVDVRFDRIIAGPSGRASAIFAGHDGLRITNASGRSVAFMDGRLHGVVAGGYTNAAVQGTSRRGTVAVRRKAAYGDWLIAGCRVPWKDHVEPGKDIEPGDPGEVGVSQNVGVNRWGRVSCYAFEDKAGAISGEGVGPVEVGAFHTDRSGGVGLSVADDVEATVRSVTGEGTGRTSRWRGETYPFADLQVSQDARHVTATLHGDAFATVDSRAEDSGSVHIEPSEGGPPVLTIEKNP